MRTATSSLPTETPSVKLLFAMGWFLGIGGALGGQAGEVLGGDVGWWLGSGVGASVVTLLFWVVVHTAARLPFHPIGTVSAALPLVVFSLAALAYSYFGLLGAWVVLALCTINVMAYAIAQRVRGT